MLIKILFIFILVFVASYFFPDYIPLQGLTFGNRDERYSNEDADEGLFTIEMPSSIPYLTSPEISYVDLLINELPPRVVSSIMSFINKIDFSEIISISTVLAQSSFVTIMNDVEHSINVGTIHDELDSFDFTSIHDISSVIDVDEGVVYSGTMFTPNESIYDSISELLFTDFYSAHFIIELSSVTLFDSETAFSVETIRDPETGVID